MSVRELFPFFKWGFSVRRSNFLVPIISNNVIVTGEEAVGFDASSRSELAPPPPAPVRTFPSSNSPEDKRDNSDSDSSEGEDNNNNDPSKRKHKRTQKRSSSPHPPPPKTNIIDKTIARLTNAEIISRIESGELPQYKLESELDDCTRAVEIRRQLVENNIEHTISLKDLPYENFDYTKVHGACCENVIGFIPIPLGFAGPLLLNGVNVSVPMATTEGCLIASTHRGSKAVSDSGGVTVTIIKSGMTRAPVVRFPDSKRAAALIHWVNEPMNFSTMKRTFESTSRFAVLDSVATTIAGRLVYLRFRSQTGDAMGMNMISKGVEKVLEMLGATFPDMEVIALSGNMCCDKKPAAINWIEGRGRTVVADAVISAHVIHHTLKTTAQALVDLNRDKNLIGSAMAGSIGGYNAHAANIVAAIFLATGQDPAQVVESANCITLMEVKGKDLYISCTMPSLEVGTVGGGTFLPAQATCLGILGVKGACYTAPGAHADQLARIICGTVLAGELSLMSALAAGQLMASHLALNRSKNPDANATSTTTTHSPTPVATVQHQKKEN